MVTSTVSLSATIYFLISFIVACIFIIWFVKKFKEEIIKPNFVLILLMIAIATVIMLLIFNILSIFI